jgi:hypothetical protein
MLGSIMPLMEPVSREIHVAASTVKESIENTVQKWVGFQSHIFRFLMSPRVEAAPSARRRVGRPKKSETSVEQDDSSAVSVPRRRGRSLKKLPVDTDEAVDPSYTPSKGVIEEGDGDAEEDWEAAALAWGLVSVGGLGVGSGAVYGAEILAR